VAAAFKLSGCCETQRKGESIHSPETCLPGSEWEFKNAGSVTVPLIFPPGLANQHDKEERPHF
jgi:hypothetical protein